MRVNPRFARNRQPNSRVYPTGSGSSQYQLQATAADAISYIGGVGKFYDYDNTGLAVPIARGTGKTGLPNGWQVDSFTGSSDDGLIHVLQDRRLEVPVSNPSPYSFPLRVRQGTARQTSIALYSSFRLYRNTPLKLRGWVKLEKLVDRAYAAGSGIRAFIKLLTDEEPTTWAEKTISFSAGAFLSQFPALNTWVYVESLPFSLDSSTQQERNTNFPDQDGNYWRGRINNGASVPNDPQFNWGDIGGKWAEARLQFEIKAGFEGSLFFNNLELVEANPLPINLRSAQSSTFPYLKEVSFYWYNDPSHLVGGGEIPTTLYPLYTPCRGGESWYTAINYTSDANLKHPRQKGWMPIDSNDKAQAFYKKNEDDLRLHPVFSEKITVGAIDHYYQAEGVHTGGWFDLLLRSGSRAGLDNWLPLNLYGRADDYHYFGTCINYGKRSPDVTPTPDFPLPETELGADTLPIIKDYFKLYSRTGTGAVGDPYVYTVVTDSTFWYGNSGNDDFLALVKPRLGAYLSSMGITHCKFDTGNWNAPRDGSGNLCYVKDSSAGAYFQLTDALHRERLWKHIRECAKYLLDNHGIYSACNMAATTMLDGSAGESQFVATENVRADGTKDGGGGNLADCLEGVMYEVTFVSGYVDGSGNLQKNYMNFNEWVKQIESANRSGTNGMLKIQYGLHIVGTTKAEYEDTLSYGMASVYIASSYAWENVYFALQQGIRNPNTLRFEGELGFKAPIDDWDLGFPKAPYSWLTSTKDGSNRYTDGIAKANFHNGIVIIRPAANDSNTGTTPQNVILNETRDMINVVTGASVLKNATLSVASGKGYILQYV